MTHRWKNNHPKPIIGLAGGIGSGKSLVAGMLAELGAGVISADEDAHAILKEPAVRDELVKWWGAQVLKPDGHLNRKAIAAIVFNHPQETAKLNGLIHPKVAEKRRESTAKLLTDPIIKAVIWDAPLLYETGMNQECDAVIFVQSPLNQRVARVQATRGWSSEDLAKREKMQMPLDKKEKMADYVVDNSGEVSTILRQVQRVFSQILARQK